MGKGEIRSAVASRRQAAAAAEGRHEQESRRPAGRIEVAQDAEARVVAAGAEEQLPLVFYVSVRAPAALLDPFIDELFGKHPLAGNPGARELTGLGEVVDLLLVNS